MTRTDEQAHVHGEGRPMEHPPSPPFLDAEIRSKRMNDEQRQDNCSFMRFTTDAHGPLFRAGYPQPGHLLYEQWYPIRAEWSPAGMLPATYSAPP